MLTRVPPMILHGHLTRFMAIVGHLIQALIKPAKECPYIQVAFLASTLVFKCISTLTFMKILLYSTPTQSLLVDLELRVFLL
jgi:hypothetical protein